MCKLICNWDVYKKNRIRVLAKALQLSVRPTFSIYRILKYFLLDYSSIFVSAKFLSYYNVFTKLLVAFIRIYFFITYFCVCLVVVECVIIII